MFKDKIIKEYDSKYLKREDNNHLLKYFMPNDFKDMNHKAVRFASDKGQILNGYIFYNKSLNEYDNLIVLLHGAGGGYLSYMKEIYTLVKGGYLVFTYDYTGTFSSEGDSLNGFSQPLIDFKYAYEYIKSEPKLKNLDLYLFGHSWGGFVSLNALNYKDFDIKKVVALAPIASLKTILEEQIKGFKKYIAIPEILKYEKEKFGEVATFNAFDAMKSDADILVVASNDDPIVSFKKNFLKLKKTNSLNNHYFLEVNNRLHNPNYTKDASQYLAFVLNEFEKLVKDNKLTTFEDKQLYFSNVDFDRASQQDKDVFSKIFDFLGGYE